MPVLIAIALKSLLVAGITLGLLQLMKNRSAAERSWVAHVGLFALVALAVAPLVLPAWNIEAPALLGQAPVQQTAAPLAQLPITYSGAPAVSAAATAPSRTPISAAAAASAVYALPAAILLLITMLALARLIALRARADVLVDGHWLSALARAQRRMGFKHGTALLTSDELASPISWGVMRPVILLNTRAVEASSEAEAIIAHELAHVARMDWMKLLLARVATALFWFNPLVWILAREAHQLREETADDAVLAADIADTDYAQLLVGVARHECPGLLLGAHGVAPSKSSLARRVARVLDGKSVRGPAAGGFAAGVFVGAVLIAAPLAALTLTPAGIAVQSTGRSTIAASEPASAYYPGARELPADLPHIIANGVSTSVTSAVAAISQSADGDFSVVAPNGLTVTRTGAATVSRAPSGATVTTGNGRTVSRDPSGATVTVYPPDASGRRRVESRAANGALAVAYADADVDVPGAGSDRDNALDTAIEMKAMGLSPEYAAAVRAASPALRNASLEDLIGLKAVGVTPQYVQELTRAGYGGLGVEEIQQARAVGLTPDYMRAIRATGVRATIDDLVELRTMGVTPGELARVRASGAVTKERIREALARPPQRPPPPRPPRPPSPDGDD
jgi:bla regulator protein blaR1